LSANIATPTLPRTSFLSTVRSYVAITKPMIISLLLVTTVPAMIAAEGGWPSTWLVVATLIGGTLSAGGANAVNCWYDRDIDAIMRRTRSRPLVTGEIAPPNALAFGISLGVGAFLFLWVTTTLAAALLSLAGYLFYVFIYTMWLTRRTPQNIVIGGAAGAFPPMVGWAAVSGDVSLASVLMFAVVFFWTPPHFWALALRLNGDYEQAGVPMMPVVYGPRRTRLEILVYTFVLVATTIALGFAAGLSWIYLATAVGLGGWFIVHAIRLWSTPEQVAPISLYKFSLLYLGLLFLAIGADVLLLA
jgi:protoheme IX farnesyltransferase